MMFLSGADAPRVDKEGNISNLSLLGEYSAANFNAGPDDHGGTLICRSAEHGHGFRQSNDINNGRAFVIRRLRRAPSAPFRRRHHSYRYDDMNTRTHLLRQGAGAINCT
jgi:hypothetical protein